MLKRLFMWFKDLFHVEFCPKHLAFPLTKEEIKNGCDACAWTRYYVEKEAREREARISEMIEALVRAESILYKKEVDRTFEEYKARLETLVPSGLMTGSVSFDELKTLCQTCRAPVDSDGFCTANSCREERKT